MKKYVVCGIIAVLGLLLVFFGSDLLGLYRLQQFVTASEEAYRVDKGAWPHPVDACTNCHGSTGNSMHQGYPSLAGQPAPYLAAQLRHFASGERVDANMGPLAKTMDATEIELFSEYFAGKPATENRFFEPDPQLREWGEQLVSEGGCAACHGDGLMGQDQFPRLAGQGYDYLLKQFNAFAAGSRKEPSGTMNSIAASFSPDERQAMANYLAALAPAKN